MENNSSVAKMPCRPHGDEGCSHISAGEQHGKAQEDIINTAFAEAVDEE